MISGRGARTPSMPYISAADLAAATASWPAQSNAATSRCSALVVTTVIR